MVTVVSWRCRARHNTGRKISGMIQGSQVIQSGLGLYVKYRISMARKTRPDTIRRTMMNFAVGRIVRSVTVPSL